MALSLNAIKNDRRSTSFEFMGDVVNFTYKPGVFTPARESQIRDIQQNEGADEVANAGLQLIVDMVEVWDLLASEADPTPIPIDVEHLSTVPQHFINALTEHMLSDMRPDPEAGRRSAGGSLRRVR